MINAVAIIRVSEQGMTHPFICKGEDGNVYYCKGNHTGIKALRCEWMCANIAKILGLPIPDFTIMEVSLDLFDAWQNARRDCIDQFVTQENNFVFASKKIRNVNDVQDANGLQKFLNRAEMARILMFDKLIRNVDRADFNSNILITNGESERVCYIIDHNMAFDPDFEIKEFMSCHVLRDYYSGIDDATKNDFLQRVRDLVTTSFLDDMWNRMPEVWQDGIYDDVAVTLDNIKEAIKEGVEV